MGDLHRRTKEKQHYLQARGYLYHSMWSCQWKALKRNNLEVKNAMVNFQHAPPMNPRDCLGGGRTEAFNLLAISSGSKTISYKDAISLYPAVMRGHVDRPFPVGKPVILKKDFGRLEDRFGICHARVQPPRALGLPVLACKINGKAMYTLCPKCAEVSKAGGCPHVDSDREFSGVWTTPELLLAKEKGYKITTIYEQWDYPTKSASFFSNFVTTFFRIKIQNSGWPDGCLTDKARHAYLKDLEEKEGIRLTVSDITDNPTQRLIAKLILNSSWGR